LLSTKDTKVTKKEREIRGSLDTVAWLPIIAEFTAEIAEFAGKTIQNSARSARSAVKISFVGVYAAVSIFVPFVDEEV
jgi:hypothetical protein